MREFDSFFSEETIFKVFILESKDIRSRFIDALSTYKFSNYMWTVFILHFEYAKNFSHKAGTICCHVLYLTALTHRCQEFGSQKRDSIRNHSQRWFFKRQLLQYIHITKLWCFANKPRDEKNNEQNKPNK